MFASVFCCELSASLRFLRILVPSESTVTSQFWLRTLSIELAETEEWKFM